MRGTVFKRCGKCSRTMKEEKQCVHCGHVHWSWAYKTDLPRGTDGKRRQRTRSGFRTKRDAERELGRLVSRIQGGQWIESGRKTLGEFAREWLNAVRLTLRYGGWESYEGRLRLYILPVLGDVRLDRINPAALNSLYADLLETGGKSGKGLAPRTVVHVHRTIHRLFEDAVRWGEVTTSPARHADPPRVARAEMQVWTATDLRRFLQYIQHDRLHHVWVLLARTGARRGEILGLQWNDVDLTRETLTIRRAHVRGRNGYEMTEVKTARSRRTISLDDACVEALQVARVRLLEEQMFLGVRNVPWIAPTENGDPVHPSWVTHRFADLIAEAGVPKLRLHDLRHTYATLGLEAGIDPRVMADRLGHASTYVTQDVYQHVSAKVEREAAERISRAIDG